MNEIRKFSKVKQNWTGKILNLIRTQPNEEKSKRKRLNRLLKQLNQLMKMKKGKSRKKRLNWLLKQLNELLKQLNQLMKTKKGNSDYVEDMEDSKNTSSIGFTDSDMSKTWKIARILQAMCL